MCVIDFSIPVIPSFPVDVVYLINPRTPCREKMHVRGTYQTSEAGSLPLVTELKITECKFERYYKVSTQKQDSQSNSIMLDCTLSPKSSDKLMTGFDGQMYEVNHTSIYSSIR